MNAGFKRAHGGVKLRIAAQEAAVLTTLMNQLLEMIEDGGTPSVPDGMPSFGISDNTEVSDDPVLARLFPDAYGDDDKASAEFRRYTEVGLRDGKRAAAATVLATLGDGGDIRLDADQAQCWLRSLNDVRLALGTRLDITEDSLQRMKDLDWDDPRYAAYAAYDWLTFLQESLVRALW